MPTTTTQSIHVISQITMDDAYPFLHSLAMQGDLDHDHDDDASGANHSSGLQRSLSD
jgi:hypothetical protein